jgi:hypothetical protein
MTLILRFSFSFGDNTMVGLIVFILLQVRFDSIVVVE